jgi:hypothetical protein
MLKYLKKASISIFRIIIRINKPAFLSSGILANHLARKKFMKTNPLNKKINTGINER